MSATSDALAARVAPLARLSGGAWAAIALGASMLILGGAAWIVRLHWIEAPYWVLVAWIAAAVAVMLIGTAARRSQESLTVPNVARRLEEGGAWRRGALTAFLDAPAHGVSAALLASADSGQAAAIVERAYTALHSERSTIHRRALTGGTFALFAIAIMGSAGPVHGTAAALWHPGRAWRETVAPVRIRASAAAVDRGRPVTLDLDALGRRQATLWLRTPGEPWRPIAIPLDSTGHATHVVRTLETDLYARLSSGGRSSDTILVRVRLPVFLGSLAVTAHYPAYLHLADEPLPTSGDTIVIPAGTRLETRGEATAALRSAGWRAAGTTLPLGVSAHQFTGSIVPAASASFELALVTAGGAPLGGDTVRLPIRVVPDSAPRVEIPVPGADTVAPLDLRVPLVLDVRDDHGVTSVVLQSRRVSRLGFADSIVRETIRLPAGPLDRAILSHTLLLERRGLLPGDTIRYVAIASDNAPAAHIGTSREFFIRIPTGTEMRAAQREASSSIAGRLDSIADRTRRLERQAEDLAREQPRAENGSRAPTGESLPFERAKRAESVARAQEQLMKDAEELERSLEALQESAKQAGLNDPEWQKHLDQIRQELDRALTPALREKLAELQKALKDLDAERAQQALKELSEAQKQLRDALERSRELFKRAALEGDLANLSQEAKDLAQEQQRWNEQEARAADSTRSAAAEKALAARADSLAAALARTAEQVSDSARSERIEQNAKAARTAADQMKQAQKSASAGQRQQAQQQGRNASRSLQPVSQSLDAERKGMQQEWREEVSQALDKALAETTRLAERELRVQQQFREGSNLSAARGEQGAVEEGVDQVIDQVRKAAGKNALVSPQAGAALNAARQQMQQAREAVSSAAPNGREAADAAGGAVDALNAASYELVRARGDVSGAESGSGMAEAIERMGQLAGQQGQLGQQGAALLPGMGAGGMQGELQRLGREQRALGEQLERLRAQGSMPGAGELANEARDLARQLEAGRLNRQTVERQERLFRRMLDAGRTLQGHEEDEKKERQSTSATGDNALIPPALRARLLDERNRVRMPGWEQLQQLSPEERRLVVDYFRKLADKAR